MGFCIAVDVCLMAGWGHPSGSEHFFLLKVWGGSVHLEGARKAEGPGGPSAHLGKPGHGYLTSAQLPRCS